MENKNKNINDTPSDFERDHDINNRWRKDRRNVPGRGYTYVSSVGWICRREKKRRKDDALKD